MIALALVLGALVVVASRPSLAGYAIAALLPGARSRSVEHLDPALRRKLGRVVERLETRGFTPVFRSTWRSPRYQETLYTVGVFAERLGRSPWTKVRGGDSCHNHTGEGGVPAARAADINDMRARTAAEKADFYVALGEEAEREGLRWGGRWRRSNPVWRRFDLGWDPAHVELQPCGRRRGPTSGGTPGAPR